MGGFSDPDYARDRAIGRLAQRVTALEQAFAELQSKASQSPVASDGEARQTKGLRATELKDNKDSQVLSAIRGEGAALSNGSDHEGDGR